MTHAKDHRVILASRSPERRELLAGMFKDFDVEVADIDETFSEGEGVVPGVLRLAEQKLLAVSKKRKGLIIASDTVIFFDKKIYGKAADESQARTMLRELGGHAFEVYTASAVMTRAGKIMTHLAQSLVEMKDWGDSDLKSYMASGQWKERAGCFSIKEANCPVRVIAGEVDTVRGLTTSWLARFRDA